jgi:hypothetical protein
MRLSRPFALFIAGWAASLPACGTADTVGDAPPVEPTCPALIEDHSVLVPDPPDGAAACAEGACNYQTQAGCADDEACRPQFNAKSPDVAPGCEAAGSGKAGDECAAQSDCARGLYCDPLGTCRKLCCGSDWSACDAGESCIRTLQVKAGGKVVSAGVDLCFPVGTCDLFDTDSCSDEPSRECKIVDPTGAVACAPRSTQDLGEPCAPPTVCKQGLTCAGGICTKLCSFTPCGTPACTPAEGTCTHYDRDPPGIGECISRSDPG